MTSISDRVQSVLDVNNLQTLTFEPGSTPTSEMAAGTSASGVPVSFEQLKQIVWVIECAVMR
ncbi:MAG: hypothetical protein GY820_33955 [Gammaproteobacteria bacterium]|nr:hypothetical protein [Gammaproteobacteria bacterium]